MSKKTKARPATDKDKTTKSITASCAACGSTIHVGDRIGNALVPVGVTFDGELIGYSHVICGACVDTIKTSDEGRTRIAEAITQRFEAAPEGVTLQ